MRQAVLDIGSNTGHLLVVDAHRGAAPLPASSLKSNLRLAEHITNKGALSDHGINSLVDFIRGALVEAEDQGCESVLGFATSAIREASNADEVVALVLLQTNVELEILSGEDEARLTFLAVRRWFGWSSGRLAVFDIGGGSLEIAAGSDERPDVAVSYELGAGRLTRNWFPDDVPTDDQYRAVRKHVRTEIAREAGALLRLGVGDHAVATSKTFRSLARMCGAAPSGDGPFVRRQLKLADLKHWLPKVAAMSSDERASLPGISASRAHQLVAGGIVAEAAMDLLGIDSLEICPWALREGVILQRLDAL
ncbi:MAG TPA: Ppx/GppA phosphatase family protein [Nocardioidaceae bacterium]|nr:Ppx/GppA phosphatase family protein [Nocardioidaceae bacterium]